MINPITVATRPWTLSAVGMILLLAGALGSARGAASAAQEPRDITVLVGAGQDTEQIKAFFPQVVRVRAGDTITWVQNSGFFHTVSLVTGDFPGPSGSNPSGPPGETIPVAFIPVPDRPGVTQLNPPAFRPQVEGDTYSGVGFVSSGRLAGLNPTPTVDPIDSFSLIFDTPGFYPYICLVHPEVMAGTVEVVEASAAAPSQAEIDAQAQAEIAVLTALMERAKAQANLPVRSEPGPGNTNVWFVRAGNTQGGVNDERIELTEFLPRDLTISAGDAVVWFSAGPGHTVTFDPAPPPPSVLVGENLPDGSVAVIRNPEVFRASKPSGVFDPAQYFNSAILASGPGTAWTLSFERPGTFEYFCALHRDFGMVGSITVVPR